MTTRKGFLGALLTAPAAIAATMRAAPVVDTMSYQSMIDQFVADLEAGLIGCRTAVYDGGATQNEIDAGRQPSYVAYTLARGPFYDSVCAAADKMDDEML